MNFVFSADDFWENSQKKEAFFRIILFARNVEPKKFIYLFIFCTIRKEIFEIKKHNISLINEPKILK